MMEIKRIPVYEEITAESICGDGLPLDVIKLGPWPRWKRPIGGELPIKIVVVEKSP